VFLFTHTFSVIQVIALLLTYITCVVSPARCSACRLLDLQVPKHHIPISSPLLPGQPTSLYHVVHHVVPYNNNSSLLFFFLLCVCVCMWLDCK
jgi:hypothetical protein